MKRRQFATQATIGMAAASLATLGQAHERADDEGSKPTFVFVHGAWHGGWCWSKVVKLLAQQGYRSIAVDLPGHGVTAKFPLAYSRQDLQGLATEPSPLAAVTLNDYRDHVISIVQGLTARGGGPVVLVGHSLGGATVSAVGEAIPKSISQLIYLTAFVPVVRQTVLEYLQQPNFASSLTPTLFVADPTVVGAFRINPNSIDAAYRARTKATFYADLTDDQFQATANLLTPDDPVQAGTDPVVTTWANWGRVPRAFIRCLRDRSLPIAMQDQMIAEADAMMPGNRFDVRTLDTDHSSFESNPDALVRALTTLVAKRGRD